LETGVVRDRRCLRLAGHVDYRRDLFIAQAEVVLAAGGIWALPLAALYGAGVAIGRRRRSDRANASEKPPPDDSRYRA